MERRRPQNDRTLAVRPGWITTIALGLAVLLVPALAESPSCVIGTPPTILISRRYYIHPQVHVLTEHV